MAKVLLAKHNDMVKAIPPDRSDKPLRTSVLPRRSWCDRPIPYAHCSKTPDEGIAIDAIPISNDISWRLLPAIGLRELTGNPFGHSDARSHPATESRGGNAARSEIHTTAETRSSGPRTYPSMRSRRHDLEEKSSSLATVTAFSSPCILQRWSARHRCRA
jgi:hypothetical protein